MSEVRNVKLAVDAVLPLVAQRADDLERARRLPDDLVAALKATGLNRLTVPAALGGLQAPVADGIDVVERLAAVDASTAWCAVIGFGTNLFSGYLPEAGAKVIFGDPNQGNATMFAPLGRLVPESGHYRLTGRWPFTSNCLHAGWAGLGSRIEGVDDDGSVPRVAFIPMSDLTVEDTWDSVGLRGTGSHHVAASDVVVSADRVCSFADRPWAEGTLWRLPMYTVLVPLLAAVPLGIARGALDEIGRQARDGRAARRGQLVDDPTALADLAMAESRLRAARAGLLEAVVEAWDVAAGGGWAPRPLQARIALASLHACDVGVDTTSVAHQLGGGAAAYTGNRLLRALVDIHAARQHLLFAPTHRPVLGRALVGLDVSYPPFVV
jgi:alkylation response protein AidB-like acyl-CoA dehydrogenase